MSNGVIGLAALTGVADAGAAYEDYKGEQSQEAALATQSKEIKLATIQKTISNYDLVEKTIKTQRAAESVRGVDMSSPSFNAIQRGTINTGAKNQSNINTESDISLANISTEESNVRDKLYSDLFKDITGGATEFATFMNKMPSSLNTDGDNS